MQDVDEANVRRYQRAVVVMTAVLALLAGSAPLFLVDWPLAYEALTGALIGAPIGVYGGRMFTRVAQARTRTW